MILVVLALTASFTFKFHSSFSFDLASIDKKEVFAAKCNTTLAFFCLLHLGTGEEVHTVSL